MITKEFLDAAAKAYFEGSPIISDAQFDAMASAIGYTKVGAEVNTKVVQHYKAMYSLVKHYEDEGKIRPLANVSDVSASIKLDGAAISLLYINGELAQAATRGDGKKGQNITDKIKATNLVPLKIEGNIPEVFQVTGEVVAPLNIENARNYAAGALNLKSVDEFKSRVLSFYAYGVYPYLTEKYSTDMMALERFGFNTVKAPELLTAFPSDGMVYRVNSNALFESMGYTAEYPKGAYALKIRGEHVETTLLNVEWQVGKSGKVTPVAILEPVYIGDALVSRATLNNHGFIEALGIEIGDTVAVIRAGEIIPCITHKVEA